MRKVETTATAPKPLWSLACFSALSMAQRGLGLLLLPIYVRHIPAAEFGVLAVVQAVAAVIATVSTLKLDAAMRTYYFDYHDDPARLQHYVRQVFSASVCCATIVYIAALAAGSNLFEIIFTHEEIAFFPAGAIALATASTNACMSAYFVYLRNSLRLGELIRWQLGLLIGTVALQILLVARMDLGMYGVLWGALLPAIGAILLLCTTHPGLLTPRVDWRILAPSLKYALPLVGLGLLYALGTRLDRIVLEREGALESLGAYAILLALFGFVKITLNSLDNTIRPYLYPAMNARGGSAGSSLERYQSLYLMVGLIGLSVAVFLGSNLHLVTDDPDYVRAQDWLLLAAAAFVPMIFTRCYTLLYEYHKHSGQLTAGVLARFVFLYLLLTLLVPELGIGGALWAILIADSLNAVAFCVLMRWLFGVRPALRQAALQVGLFYGTIVILARAMDEESTAFGALQLVAVTVLLLLANQRNLRVLMAPVPARSVGVVREGAE